MEDVVRKQACDIIQPDVTNYGSLQEVQHAAAMADARYMTIAPHNPNAGVSTAASVHLCAGLENLEVLEVPDDPGLGVTFHPEAARVSPGEPKDSHSLFDEEGALKRP